MAIPNCYILFVIRNYTPDLFSETFLFGRTWRSRQTEHKGLVETQTSAFAIGQELLTCICVPSLAVGKLFVFCHATNTILWKLYHTVLCALYFTYFTICNIWVADLFLGGWSGRIVALNAHTFLAPGSIMCLPSVPVRHVTGQHNTDHIYIKQSVRTPPTAHSNLLQLFHDSGRWQ
jgi:hypothetical protein